MSSVIEKHTKAPGRRVGEFPLPPSSKEVKKKIPETDEEAAEGVDGPSPVPEMPGNLAASALVDDPDALPITEGDREKFLLAIMLEHPYTETFSLMEGKMKVVLRTRSVSESEEALAYVRGTKPEATVDVEMALSRSNLSYALESIENVVDSKSTKEVFDDPEKTLKDRMERLGKFPTPKYTALIWLLSRFDRKVFVLGEEVSKPNFS